MLLLVLIFVLAAFGLLLVALVTGTAAWAWISVVVSVAAAGILVYDWAQRRAAVRSNGAGERSPGVPSGPPAVSMHIEESPTTAIPVLGDTSEPATEVFPALRQGYPTGPPGADSARTTAIPTPPGSADRPSGAEPNVGSPAARQSPNVTPAAANASEAPSSGRSEQSAEHGPGADFGDRGAPPAAAPPVADTSRSAEGADAAVPRQDDSRDKAAAGSADGRPADRGADQDRVDQDLADRAKGGAQSPQPTSQAEDDYAKWQPRRSDQQAAQGSAGSSGGQGGQGAGKQGSGTQGPGNQNAAGQSPAATSGAKAPAGNPPTGRNVVPEQAGRPPAGPPSRQTAPAERPQSTPAAAEAKPAEQGQQQPREADRTTAISSAAVAAAAASAAVGLSGAKNENKNEQKPQQAEPSSPSERSAPTQADQTTALPIAGAQRVGQDKPLQRAEATQAITPVKGGPPAEPGEEKPDASALAIASTLSDEVLVVDEHPRFHLSGCRVLAGNETIPLPAKEAIEYGFSPCSVCSPVRVLASRNRAASSS